MFSNGYRIGLLAVLTASAISCSKQAAEEPTPVEAQTAQTTTKSRWATFLDDVETGKRKDPAGQYVSKATQVPNGDSSVARPTRRKLTINDAKSTNLYQQPSDPIGDCPGGCAGGPPPTPEPTSGFFSSAGYQMGVNPADNPNNYILNLTIIKGDQPYFPNEIQPRAGYAKIPVDLNKGAGGKAIYLCYTRYSKNVAETPFYNPAGHWDYCINAPSTAANCYNDPDKFPITTIDAVSVNFIGTTNPAKYTGYDWIYNYAGIYTFEWKYPDLNDGAGGRYVYPEVSKGFTNTYPPIPTTPIKEVGVLYSNDDSTPPPTGWFKVPQDLNDGAGGYFIYFCYKK